MPSANHVEIRRARKDDIPFVLRMWSFILGDLVKGHPHFRPSFRATSGIAPHMMRLLDDEDTLVLVAVRGSRRVGFLNASVGRGHAAAREERIGLVENIYVEPGIRGSGSADALLGQAMRWLEGKNVRMVEAVCEANNNRAIGFFGKFGFDLLTLALVRPLRARVERRATDRRGSRRTPRQGKAKPARSASPRR